MNDYGIPSWMDEILKYLPLLSLLSVFFLYLIRKEAKDEIVKAQDVQREYTELKIKEVQEECKYHSLQDRNKTDRLSERMMELEKSHVLEIGLLKQTTSTTDKRLDMIETRIEKLDTKFDEKFEEQKELPPQNSLKISKRRILKMILQILKILIPLIRKFLSLKAIQTNQNCWNESSIALANKKKISREEVFGSISNIPIQRDPIFRLPVSNPHITSKYEW